MLIKQINNNCYARLNWYTSTDAYYNRVQFNFDWTIVCLNKQQDLKIESLGTVELYCATGSSLNDTTGSGYSITVDPIADFTANGFFINTRDLDPGEYSAVQNEDTNLPFAWMFASTIQGEFLSPIEIKWTGFEAYVGGELVTDTEGVAYETAQPSVYRLVEASMPTTYIGSTAAIALDRGYTSSNLPIDLTYTIGEYTGTIVLKSNASTTYNWALTEDLKNHVPNGTIYSPVLIQCSTYDRFGSLIGQTNYDGAIIFDTGIQPAEIRTLDVVPTSDRYESLTGSRDVGIKYFSDFYVDCVFVPATGATVVSKKVTTESGQVYDITKDITLILPAVSDNYITVECEDSYGFKITERKWFPIIEYEKPICFISSSSIETDGTAQVTISGSFFNQSFGAMNNTLELLCFVAPTSYGDVFGGDRIVVNNITYNSANFTATVNLSGLNYETSYYCQAWATDRMMTYNSSIITMGGKALFDWGKDDFQFNITVNANENIHFATDKAITGSDPLGNMITAMVPCDSEGFTTIGYSSYQNETRGTNIYGNEINLFAIEDVHLNSRSLVGLLNAITTAYNFTPTFTAGPNFTSASMALTLRGNCLYCRVYGFRTDISNTGDFEDELLGSFSFTHEGKIKSMDYVDGITGGSGPTAAVSMKNVSVGDTTASFDVYLTSSATGARSFLSNFVIPVTIDVNKFV